MKNCGTMSKEGAWISQSLFDVKCSVELAYLWFALMLQISGDMLL